jgi:PBSX family phage terminase large subunit
MPLAPFSPKSRAFIKTHPKDDAFINILEGSVRSGKTWTMIPKIFRLCDYDVPGHRVFFGVSKNTIYNNVLSDLFDFVGSNNYNYNRQTGDLRLYNSDWLVTGAKDEGSEKYIRGLTVGIAVGDELTLTPESFFNMMLTRMSPDGARLYGTTNPDNPYHYLKTDYIDNEKKLTSNYVKALHFTLADNLSLSPEKRKQYETMYKGVFKKRYIDGLWVVAEGAIYKDCLEGIEYDDAVRPIGLDHRNGHFEICVPVDYGTGNPTVFLLIIDDGKTFWVDREYYYDSKETAVQKTDVQYVKDLKEFISKYAPNGAQCIVDPSAASLKAEMAMQGVWNSENADNEVIDGIRTVSSLLAKKKIRIHKRCVKLLTELQTYAWDTKAQARGEDKPLKQHDHAPDALRYFCQTKVPAWRIAA